MSDLISRKALLEELKNTYVPVSVKLIDIITNAPAITQGEPVAVCTVKPLQGNESARLYEIKWMNGNPIEGWLYTSPPQPQVVKDAPAVESETSYCGKDYSVGSGGFEKVYVCGEDDGQCGWCKCLDYRSPAVKDALEKAASIVQAKIGHYYPTPLTDAVTEIRALKGKP